MSENKYKRGKIYCIRSYQTDLIYIGSTCETLARRMSKHRTDMKRDRVITSTKILQYEDAYIELLEAYPCNTKDELTKKEGEYIRSSNCVNKVIPNRTYRQYYLDNKDIIDANNKLNKIKNREKVNEHKRIYYEENKTLINNKARIKVSCDICNKEMRKNNLTRHKKTIHNKQ